jgi:hypothetical protein
MMLTAPFEQASTAVAGGGREVDEEMVEERARLTTLKNTMAAEDAAVHHKRLETMHALRASWAAQVATSQQKKAEEKAFTTAWPWASMPAYYSREAVHAWK